MKPRLNGIKALSMLPVLGITLVVYFTVYLIGLWSEVIFTKQTVWFLMATYAIYLSGFAMIVVILYFSYCLQYGCIHLINHVLKKNIRTRTFIEVTQFLLYLFPVSGYQWVCMRTLWVALLICLMGLMPALILCYGKTKKNSCTLRETRKEAYHVGILSLITTLVTCLIVAILYYDVYYTINTNTA